jgi:hypothetical protein
LEVSAFNLKITLQRSKIRHQPFTMANLYSGRNTRQVDFKGRTPLIPLGSQRGMNSRREGKTLCLKATFPWSETQSFFS